MNRNFKIFFAAIVIGMLGMVAYYFIEPKLKKDAQTETSDAAGLKGEINIGVDNWIGYFPLCSPNLRTRMISAGYLLKCNDDKADYTSRFKSLKRGNLQFAVGTLDAYMLNGQELDYPGTIVAVLDESKGGDALVAWEKKISNLDFFKSAENFKIAFTPASPSEFLLKSIGTHFDITALKSKKAPWRVETEGASAALKEFLDNKVDAAVLWEPELSRATANEGVKILLSSADTSGLIVDVLIVAREYSQKNPDVVKILLANYFRTLRYYRDNHDSLVTDVKQFTKLPDAAVTSMLKGVSWQTLSDNTQVWYGLNGGSEKLTDSIDSVIKTLTETGDFSANPLAGGNSYMLQNRVFVQELSTTGLSGGDASTTVTTTFKPLEDSEWAQLRDVGTLKIRPITFQSGNDVLSDEGISELKEAVESLRHYPNFRIIVKGHSGLRGEAAANKTLSQERGDAVKRYVIDQFGFDSNRIKSIGMGSEQPLARLQGESDREYNYRLPRVELHLVTEVF
jgi:outer membrane protein OmpA-like peptidoglycan-associated protein